jgi:hypothetical protein
VRRVTRPAHPSVVSRTIITTTPIIRPKVPSILKPWRWVSGDGPVEKLIRERERIAAAKWTSVLTDTSLNACLAAVFSSVNWSTSTHGGFQLADKELADEQLAWATEEFRTRRLASFDAQLRELGVEPPQLAAADA